MRSGHKTKSRVLVGYLSPLFFMKLGLGFLAEFMWRSKLPFGCDPFDIILEDISKFMPPQ